VARGSFTGEETLRHRSGLRGPALSPGLVFTGFTASDTVGVLGREYTPIPDGGFSFPYVEKVTTSVVGENVIRVQERSDRDPIEIRTSPVSFSRTAGLHSSLISFETSVVGGCRIPYDLVEFFLHGNRETTRPPGS